MSKHQCVRYLIALPVMSMWRPFCARAKWAQARDSRAVAGGGPIGIRTPMDRDVSWMGGLSMQMGAPFVSDRLEDVRRCVVAVGVRGRDALRLPTTATIPGWVVEICV